MTKKELKRIESYYMYKHDGSVVGTLKSCVFCLKQSYVG